MTRGRPRPSPTPEGAAVDRRRMKSEATDLSPLYPIIDLSVLLRPLEAVLADLAGAGVTWVQLRGKRLSSKALFDRCCRLVALARPLSLKVIVNDRADLAWLSGADGVHLGQDDLPCAEARKLLGAEAIIGLSTHGLEQARQAEGSVADYVAIGPVFPTRSKENPEPVVDWSELGAVRESVTKPLIAIGGITSENARPLFELGVDSVAVIRNVLLAPDIREQAGRFLESARQAGEGCFERSRVSTSTSGMKAPESGSG